MGTKLSIERRYTAAERASANEDQVSISLTFYKQLLRVQIPKVQKDSQVVSIFCTFGIYEHKSLSYIVDEIDYRSTNCHGVNDLK